MTYAAIALFLFVLIALAFTGFTDPGIIFHREYEIDPEVADMHQVIECAQCRVKRPHTARHCYRCGVCVDQVSALSILFSLHLTPRPFPAVGSPLPLRWQMHRKKESHLLLCLRGLGVSPRLLRLRHHSLLSGLRAHGPRHTEVTP
jgi:hypothetical protein